MLESHISFREETVPNGITFLYRSEGCKMYIYILVMLL